MRDSVTGFLVVACIAIAIGCGVYEWREQRAACADMKRIAKTPADSIAALQYCYKKPDVITVYHR